MQRLIFVIFMLLFTNVSVAHESRPIVIQINEAQTHQYQVQAFFPLKALTLGKPQLQFPATCKTVLKTPIFKHANAFMMKETVHCQQSLAKQTVSLVFPDAKPAGSILFKITMKNKQSHSALLTGNETAWTIPEKENTFSTAMDYSYLGIIHILFGIDHLLFVACLVFIARTPRRILWTITGFTVAHSITLSLSALNIFQVPMPPVEAMIALSIVFLAHEIAVEKTDSWTYQYPVLISMSFGLLHGFGFASALSDIGLPQIERLSALLFFNVGVEIGQILFLLSLYIIVFGLKAIFSGNQSVIHMSKVKVLASYLIGSVASFWLFERLTFFVT
jgi:hydrogenase/urease accessory protein HupE